MVRVGIVGCGSIAQVHAAVLAQLSHTQLVACADICVERAKAMGEKYGGTAYASLSEMLDNEKLDAVHICTPHVLHTPMAVQLAQKGIHVFMEKPPVISRTQWDELADTAQKVRIGICFQNRYNPNVKEAERLIKTGVYGDLISVRAFVTWSRDADYYQNSGWRGAWETEGGGVLINQAIHTLDLLCRFLGPVDQIEARIVNHHLQQVIEVEDTVEAYMRSGMRRGLFYASNAYSCDAPVLIELQMEKAVLRLESDTLEVIRGKERQVQSFTVPRTLGKGYWGNGHLSCIEDFYRCLDKNERYSNDLQSVASTVDVMLRIYEQGRTSLI